MNKGWIARAWMSIGMTVLCASMAGCTPGYMTPEQLERADQGPSACQKRCYDLGLQFGALVLVGNSLPGCVCVPRGQQIDPSRQGASASTAGYVVIAAAAAARQEQQRQQQQQQQQQQYHP